MLQPELLIEREKTVSLLYTWPMNLGWDLEWSHHSKDVTREEKSES